MSLLFGLFRERLSAKRYDMHCAFCRTEMRYVHGHAACVRGECPMFGLNQDECCSGDTGGIPTAWAAACAPGHQAEHRARVQEVGASDE